MIFAAGSVEYTPNADFATGSDTFQYELKDGHGGSAWAQVTVTMVEVTGYTLEWWSPTGTWEVVSPSAMLWSHDRLRWSGADRAPSVIPLNVDSITWQAKPWADRDDRDVPWQPFADAWGDAPAEGNPGDRR